MGHAENSETDFIHSPCLPRRKTAAVALLQQASCNTACEKSDDTQTTLEKRVK
jgi:hypothetical protein